MRAWYNQINYENPTLQGLAINGTGNGSQNPNPTNTNLNTLFSQTAPYSETVRNPLPQNQNINNQQNNLQALAQNQQRVQQLEQQRLEQQRLEQQRMEQQRLNPAQQKREELERKIQLYRDNINRMLSTHTGSGRLAPTIFPLEWNNQNKIHPFTKRPYDRTDVYQTEKIHLQRLLDQLANLR
jgi:hypothetical protein